MLPVAGVDQDPDTEVQATIQTQLNLAYEADLFGRVRAGAGAAQRDANAAALDLQAMRLMSTGQVLEMVLTVLEGREQLALLAKNEALLRRQRAFVVERYQAGLSNVLEPCGNKMSSSQRRSRSARCSTSRSLQPGAGSPT